MSRLEGRSTETGQAILDAAAMQFTRYGFRKTAVEDVAQEAGISKATVYLYFKSKRELFRSVCEELFEEVIDSTRLIADRDAPLEKRLRGMLEARFLFFFELIHSSPHAEELLVTRDELAREVLDQCESRYLRLLERVLRGSEDQGLLDFGRVGLSPSAAARFLVNAASANPTLHLDVDEYRRYLTELVRVFLAGATATDPLAVEAAALN